MTPPMGADYDVNVAIIAGNILGHVAVAARGTLTGQDIKSAVEAARAVIQYTRDTEPKESK